MGNKQLMAVMGGILGVLAVVLGVLIVVAGQKPARRAQRDADEQAAVEPGAPGSGMQQPKAAAPPQSAGGFGQPATQPRPAAAKPKPKTDPNLVEMREIDGPTEGVNALAFSPDGKMLAAAGVDRAVHVYDVESGKEIQKMVGHGGGVTDVRFSADSRLVVSTGQDGLLIWDAGTGKQVQAVDPKGKAVQGRFAGNDRVVTAAEGKLLIFKVGAGAEPERVIDTGSEISCMDVSPDGEHVVAGQSKAGMIRVWNVGDGSVAAEHEQGPPGMDLVHFTEQEQASLRGVQETEFLDNEHILVGAQKAGTYVLAWKEGTTESLPISLSNTDRREVWAGEQGRIVWDVAGGAELRYFDMGQGKLQSPQNRDSNGRVAFLKIGNIACSSLAIHGGWAAVGSAYAPTTPAQGRTQDITKVRLVKMQTMQAALVAERESIQKQLDKVKADELAKSQTPRGKLETAFAAAVRESSVPVAVIEGQQEGLAKLQFSPDGKYLGTAGGDHTVRLYDTSSWKEAKKLEGHTGAVSDISFSKDGKKLLSSSWDTTIVEWDVETGRILKRVSSNIWVLQCAFLPDGEHAVSSGLYVQFWDMEHEKLTGTGVTQEQVHKLAVSAGGTVASMDNNSDVTIWNSATAQPIRAEHIQDVTLRGFFIDDKTLRYCDIRKATDWNWETGAKKDAPYVETGLTPDGKLGVGEDENVIPSGGGRRLIAYHHSGPRYGAGAIDPLDRYIAFGIGGYFGEPGFVSSGPGRIVVYDVKKLEATEGVYQELAAYDKAHSLDDEGRPLKTK